VPTGDPFANNAPANSFTQANTDGDDGGALTDTDFTGSLAQKTGFTRYADRSLQLAVHPAIDSNYRRRWSNHADSRTRAVR
jgi:hypothetical protein